MRVFPTENYVINTSFWNLLSNPSYLKSIQTSMSMGVTLISGFILYTQNMRLGQKDFDFRNSLL